MPSFCFYKKQKITTFTYAERKERIVTPNNSTNPVKREEIRYPKQRNFCLSLLKSRIC